MEMDPASGAVTPVAAGESSATPADVRTSGLLGTLGLPDEPSAGTDCAGSASVTASASTCSLHDAKR
jgi:hypothetical protein